MSKPSSEPASDPLARPVTAFRAGMRIASGPLREVARVVKAAFDRDPAVATMAFDDRTGAMLDFDLGGTPEAFLEHLEARARYERYLEEDRREQARATAARGTHVVAREVTLLPRHWAWLDAQPGTPSQTLRRLVDQARHRDAGATAARLACERAYAFVLAIAGDLPGFEEASRALFAGDRARFEQVVVGWPPDVSAYAIALAWPAGAT